MSQTESTVIYPIAGQYDQSGNLKYDTVVPAVPVQAVQPVVPVQQSETVNARELENERLREQEVERERLREQELERERLRQQELERERLAEAGRAPVDTKHDSIAERLVKKVTGKA